MHVADARTGPQAHAQANRRQDDSVALLVVDADAADVIKAAVDRREALEQRVRAGQVIYQHEHLGNVAAPVETDRRTLPKNLAARAALHHQRAVAVTQANGNCAARFLALDIAIGPAVLLEGLFDHLGQPLGRL